MLPFLLMAAAAAADPPPPEAYVTAVRLVDTLFLEPSAVDPRAMLVSAARALEQELHWLLVRAEGHGVVLTQGDGTELGRVEVGGMGDLPRALARLETLVEQAPSAAGEDVRLVVLSGMTGALDRYSRVLADEKLDRFNVRLTGTLVGIGATFELDAQERLVVTGITAGGPAAQGGLAVGDRLLRVDGRSTAGMPTVEATRRIRGEKGTQVALRVERGGVHLDLAFTRAEVVVANVRSDVLEGGVGYVHIDHVSQQTVENLERALAALRAQSALERGLVIDLRGNTGGSMKESASAADLFLTGGLLLRTVGRDGGYVRNLQAEMRADDDGTEPQVPIVLVVDERTASGAEILAGALLELDRVALVGTRTYGKGTVQKPYHLDENVRFKLTVARYILANGRVIADTGIVPDVSVGRISLTGDNVRFTGWDEAFQRVSWGELLPDVDTGAGDVDLPLELARRALLAAEGPTRASVLAALVGVAADTRTEQEARLTAALAARGIDWTAAPDDGAFVDAEVTLRADPLEGDLERLVATVTNTGPDALHRVLVQLECASARWWDDVVLPVGRIEPGGVATGEVRVPLPPGIDHRLDGVDVRLRADRRPPLRVGEQVLASVSSPEPVLRISSRLLPGEGTRHRAEITVQNLSREALSGLEVHLGYPGSDAIELVDWAARVPGVGARSERRVELTLEVGPQAPVILPLELLVRAERYGELVDWPLPLPRDGSPVVLQAPRIEARTPVRAAPAGPFTMAVTVSDDRAVDHVVITVNGAKVAWAPGGASRIALVPTFELLQGANRITVATRDDQGLEAVSTVMLRGEAPTEAVDAAE